MAQVARRRPALAVTASAVAHVGLLAIAFAWRPTIPIPDTPEVPSPDAITVQLVRLVPAASRAPSALRLHRVAEPLSQAGPPVAPLPAPTSAPGAPIAAAPAPGPDLRMGLRHGAAGCADAATVGMSRAERDLCNERLGRNAARGPLLPLQLQPRLRVYYDQVAEAKAPDPAPINDISLYPGSGLASVFSLETRPTNGHGPRVGCSIHFGVGKAPNTMPHALRLGPCFIEPPKGPLTPEVDLVQP